MIISILLSSSQFFYVLLSTVVEQIHMMMMMIMTVRHFLLSCTHISMSFMHNKTVNFKIQDANLSEAHGCNPTHQCWWHQAAVSTVHLVAVASQVPASSLTDGTSHSREAKLRLFHTTQLAHTRTDTHSAFHNQTTLQQKLERRPVLNRKLFVMVGAGLLRTDALPVIKPTMSSTKWIKPTHRSF